MPLHIETTTFATKSCVSNAHLSDSQFMNSSHFQTFSSVTAVYRFDCIFEFTYLLTF